VPQAVLAGPYAVVTAVVIEALKVVVHCCFGVPPVVVTALLIAVLQAASHPVPEATSGLAVQYALTALVPAAVTASLQV
jgi:hypothetical protein